ncbi:MAG: quinohemoprotein amine dehydrogenase subunit alpha, partial [Gammaproteobacteria bacterium]|nr:quinohemoprotein amine dehydrogenase subunit alpha [Gammaproteobacteria bacterium]
MIKHRINPCSVIVAATMTLFATLAPGAAVQAQTEAKALLNARCAACHQATDDGGLSRINEVRKTPEAWDMTLVRMMLVHGVQITADERHTLAKYLADSQGLAPAETQGWRYVLERRGNVMESPPDADLAVMCARCHSYARTALQRRDTEDWLKHVHFHLGQWPTIEYQALGRDRNWWEIASTSVPEKLGELYPLNTSEWSEWQERDKVDLSGAWRVVGHQPGKGSYQGTLTVTGSGDDQYKVSMDINYASGDKASGEGNAIVYT